MYTNNNNNLSTKKPYCKVCADAKKHPSVVNSHNVRNLKNGTITCPTLLAQSCKNCGQTGHTISRCKQLKMTVVEEPDTKKAKWVKEPTPKTVKFSFSALMTSDDEDEEEDVVVKVATFPAIKIPAKPILTGYASALLSNEITPSMIRQQPAHVVATARGIPTTKPTSFVKTVNPSRPFSWADPGSESEGDEGEYDEYDEYGDDDCY